MGFIWSDSIVKSASNITGTENDLSTMKIFQKNIYFRIYSKEGYRANSNDVFYCYYVKPDTVLPKSYHDRNTVNFLK